MIRTVVVTGAGSGIGAATSRLLATRGWRVVATDVSASSVQALVADFAPATSGAHEAKRLDVTEPDEIRHLVEEVAADTGIDAWVNNAGVSLMERFVDIPLESLDHTLSINLRGVFLCAQAAARSMIEQGREGRIVNMASMAGKRGKVPFLADYVASKFGVVGLTQAMATELGPHRIAVNAVCPGYVTTPMQQRELIWEAKLARLDPSAVQQNMLVDTPLGRLQTPDDVAKAVAFLLSPDADAITGEAIAVNGGAYMD